MNKLFQSSASRPANPSRATQASCELRAPLSRLKARRVLPSAESRGPKASLAGERAGRRTRPGSLTGGEAAEPPASSARRETSKLLTSPHKIYHKHAESAVKRRTITENSPSGRKGDEGKARSGSDCFLFRELCNLRTLSNSFLTSLNNDVFLLRNTAENEKQFINSVFAELNEKLRALRADAAARLDSAFTSTMEFLQTSVTKVRRHRDSVDRLIMNFDRLEDVSGCVSVLLGELSVKSESVALPGFSEPGRGGLLARALGLLEQFFMARPVRTSFASLDAFNGEISCFRRRFSEMLSQRGDNADSLHASAPTGEPRGSALIDSSELVSLKKVQRAMNINAASLQKLVSSYSAVGREPSHESLEIGETRRSSVVESGRAFAERPRDLFGQRTPADGAKRDHLRKTSLV